MKKITFLFIVVLTSTAVFSQISVNYDTSAPQNSYVFTEDFGPNPSPGESDFSYPASAVSSTSGSDITVTPNYGIWADNDETPCAENFCSIWNPFWFEAAETPRKNTIQLIYTQYEKGANPELFNTEVNFFADLSNYGIDNAYVVQLFITVFESGFSNGRQFTTTVTNNLGTFSVTLPGNQVSGLDQTIQYGFIVIGPIADPDNLKGSVTFSQSTLSTTENSFYEFNTFPNPTQDSWTVKTQNANIKSIKVFDVLGKNVMSLKTNKNEVTINASQLISGLYFAQISTDSGTSSIKLIKQ